MDAGARRLLPQGGGEQPLTAAATVLVIKALVHDAMREERPNAKFAGYTDVTDLADAVADVWVGPPRK